MSHASHGGCSGTECPKCHRHTVIAINATLWKCLNCEFSKKKDGNKKKDSDNTGVFTVIGGFIIAAICLFGL